MLLYLILGMYLFFSVNGLVTSTFDDYLSYYGCSTLSLILLFDVFIIVF
jgi:hypothetical protein